MRGNTITIELPLKRGKVSKTIPLYQYDYGQKLIITDVELPSYYEVHFSNEMHGDAVTSIGDSTGVEIPDSLLATGENVYLWLYLHDSDSDGETEFQGAIPVIKRARVTDQTPTPHERTIIEQAVSALNSAVSDVEGKVEDAEAAQIAAEVAQAAAENAQSKAEDAQGAAETAQDAAEDAQTAAETAQGKAEDAQDAAETAQGKAEDAQEAAESAQSAAEGFAGNASDSADDAEAWAVGTEDSTHPAYGNSAKDWAEEAAEVVQGIIDDTAGDGDTDKTWSADKMHDQFALKADKWDPTIYGKISHGRKGGSTAGTNSAVIGGDNAVASGSHAIAEGQSTIAAGAYQRASGKFNVEDSGNTYAEIIGNGYAEIDEQTFVITEHRSNARALDWNGNETLAGDLTVNKGKANEVTLGSEVSNLKNESNYLNKKYFAKNINSDSDSIVYEHTGIMLKENEQIVLVQNATSTLCVAYVYPQAYSDGTDIKTKGTYTITAVNDGELYIAHRAADVDIYFPEFSIVSTEGSSKILPASQYLVKTAFDEIEDLGDDVEELSDQLDNKYDRYKVTETEGLSLDMFTIKPSQYQVVQYNDSDCLYFTSVSPAIYCFSKFDPRITDLTFVVGSQYMLKTDSTGSWIAFACTAEKAIGIGLNVTSYTVYLYTSSGRSSLESVYRNANCRLVAVGDTVHLVRNGTKVAMYLVDNGEEVPILADEFIDVYALYGTSAGISESDVCLGFVHNNSSRGENLVYDFVQKQETGDHFVSYDMGIINGLIPTKTVDLFMFMGQSNMAGRGTGSQAPKVIDGAGYEFRAVTDQTKLYNIVEPFGQNENVANAIDDSYNSSSMKSGDMIPSFVNAYYEHTRCPIVGVSASEGGTRLAYWQPETARDADAEDRFDDAVSYLTTNGYTIRHKYMLWCQGETDGDINTTKADYKTMFTAFAEEWFDRGIETIFVIKIGNYNGESGYDYSTIMTAQNEICQEMQNVVMVCTDFAGMKARDLMKDAFHYKQAGYNEVGTYAGINTALYVNTGKEPTMYDTQNGTLYYTHKN